MIPMVDLRTQYYRFKEEIDKKVLETLDKCHFILGEEVKSFENETAKYLGVKHSFGIANGTDALHLALAALDIKAGDEVIVPSFTFIATAEAVLYVGATPVFADIDPKTYNIDLKHVELLITPKTKAVIPVHLFGQPVDMNALKALQEKHGFYIVEDCAQSFGADIGGQQTGSFGQVGCFSFFPSKNLGCYGDGGLVVTEDDVLAHKLSMLRNHGMQTRYYHEILGYNSRLDELQAAILRIKLKYIDQFNEARYQVAQAYKARLKDLPLTMPFEDKIGKHVYHQLTLLTEDREKIQKALSAKNIASAIYYPVPVHKQKMFAHLPDVSLPVCEKLVEHCLSLPIYPELTEAQIDEICSVIHSIYR